MQNPFRSRDNRIKNLGYEERYKKYISSHKIVYYATTRLGDDYYIHCKVPSETADNITYDVVKEKGKDTVSTSIVNSNDNTIDENGNDVRALDDVSLSIHRGEFVAIIGTNGSGKSTFLKCLYRVLQPNHGKIFFDGTEMSSLSHRDTALKMAVRSAQFVRP